MERRPRARVHIPSDQEIMDAEAQRQAMLVARDNEARARAAVRQRGREYRMNNKPWHSARPARGD